VSGIPDRQAECHQLCYEYGANYDQSVEGVLGKKVLASLTAEQRETLRLYFVEGYTFAEIAEKLGQSFFNVRHHYYRSLEKLRKSGPKML
jgi:RNA polymerase sigma-70 factor (ECF subfamily)